MPYQYCHQCYVVWIFITILIASCVVAIFHANRGNPDKSIWPIRFFKFLTFRPFAHAIEDETRHDLSKFSWQERLKAVFWYSENIAKATRDDLKKYSWRERFLAAWFAWITIVGLVYVGVIDLLSMVGVITTI